MGQHRCPSRAAAGSLAWHRGRRPAAHRGLPHWGKVILAPGPVREAYDLDGFLGVCRTLDPDGALHNRYTRGLLAGARRPPVVGREADKGRGPGRENPSGAAGW